MLFRSHSCIDLGRECNEISVQILSMNGQLIEDRYLDRGERITIDRENMSTGVYLIRIGSSEGSVTKRLIVE